MAYYYKSGVIVPFVQKFYKQMIVVVAAIFVASMASMTFSASAAPLVVASCTFDEVGSVWTLQADCVSTTEIVIPTGVTLDGGGFTISPDFDFVNNGGVNSVLEIVSDDVTIQNLTIDGTNALNIHGINVFDSENIFITNVTSKNNDKSGIVVNSSEVTVSNVTTSGNGTFWSGINVDQKTTSPSVLNIVGPMTQTDNAQIYIDDTTKLVTVNDTLSQYTFVNPITSPVDRPNDRVYTLKNFVQDKEGCKKDGWKVGVLGQSFKNQGQCVAYFASNGQNIR